MVEDLRIPVDQRDILDSLEDENKHSEIVIDRISRNRAKVFFSSRSKYTLSMVESKHFYGTLTLSEQDADTLVMIRTRGNTTYVMMAFVGLIAIIPTVLISLSGLEDPVEEGVVFTSIFLICLVFLALAWLKQRSLAKRGMNAAQKHLLNHFAS